MKRQNKNNSPSPPLVRGIKKCLIVCNGELKKRLLNKFLDASLSLSIVACDGASNFLYRYKIIPHYITGDFDAIKSGVLRYYKTKGVTIKKIRDQNTNDLEKALKLALSKKFSKILIIGATGKRLDHTINNLSVLKRYSKKADIKFYDNTFEMFFLNKSTEFKYRKGEVVSLLALPKAAGIKTQGLKWKLNNETLELGKREGALNIASSDFVKVTIEKGDLLVFRKHFGKINL
ncbi:MAG: thiamine diphosphokinase [Chlorobi bacterium]|nr:thiamine diphosphokinase [Chlorobiota bacterium]MCI0715478.1 thiamine diphosphokinase [Chlorobiota bacterium]